MNLPQYAAVTEELIESAEWRARVIELVRASTYRLTSTHTYSWPAPDAQNEYAPANLADNLQQINKDLHELKVSMRASQVENANALIRIRNHFNSPGDLSALQKTVCIIFNEVVFTDFSLRTHRYQVLVNLWPGMLHPI